MTRPAMLGAVLGLACAEVDEEAIRYDACLAECAEGLRICTDTVGSCWEGEVPCPHDRPEWVYLACREDEAACIEEEC